LVAGAIASKVADPVAAPAISLASHFLLDSIPHWDFGADWRKRTKLETGMFAVADTVIGLFLAYYLFGNEVSPLMLFACLILSVLPDWLEAPWYIFFADQNTTGLKKNASISERACFWFYKSTNRMHSKGTFPWGLVSQVATITFFLLLLR
jgi:hypothetical protein